MEAVHRLGRSTKLTTFKTNLENIWITFRLAASNTWPRLDNNNTMPTISSSTVRVRLVNTDISFWRYDVAVLHPPTIFYLPKKALVVLQPTATIPFGWGTFSILWDLSRESRREFRE